MKKHLSIIILLFTIAFNTAAVVTGGIPLCFDQKDGTRISLKLFGDEYVHYYLTVDSVPVFEQDGGFYYGVLENEELTISAVLAHEPESRSVKERYFGERRFEVLDYFKKVHKERLADENWRRMRTTAQTRGVGDFHPYIGSRRGLVILVNFQNLTMSTENPNHEFNRMFNEVGYTENGSVGSVHDYFYDQSYGKFDLGFDVVGPVTMPETYGYYGTNELLSGYDKRAYEMVIEACRAVDKEVDFTRYDWDGDGSVDQVYIIYAGYGEHAGAPANTIWPHESQLGQYAITLDGVKINTYACSCELTGISGKKLSGIGTPCHEFSHCLGLPDLYDTDYSGAFGMDVWDLMNSGSHSGPTGNGEVPYGYSAYERWMSGWLEPKIIDDSITIEEMKNLEESPEAYIIYNEGNENEYFLIENHQPLKWFSYIGKIPGAHGMMVTHVDYDPNAWKLNIVNPKPEHQRMTIVPADMSYGYDTDELLGDLYPGAGGVTWFTSESHKTAGGKLFNRNIDGSYQLRCAVTRIKEEDGLISFEVWYDYELTKPEIACATDVDDTGFTANWNPLEEAESYTLEVRSRKKVQGFPIERVNTIEEIDGTSVRTGWIFEDGETRYRVRAVVHGIPTGWSDYMTVENDSEVEIVEAEDKDTEYYTVDGLRRNSLMKGVNIVKKGNRYKKIYVR